MTTWKPQEYQMAGTSMPLLLRLSITVIAMLSASAIAGLIWHSAFGAGMPSFLSGIVGGLAALPVWELLKRVKIKPRA
jgi:uncharacterized membrane protein